MQAIFSDDSDDEEDTSASLNKAEHPEKKVEAANTALSRLMAGDFLESLGKELGLEVPPDPPYSTNKAGTSVSQIVVNENSGNDKILNVEAKPPATTNVLSESTINHGVPHEQGKAQDGRHKKIELIHEPGDSAKSGRLSEIGSSKNKNDQVIHQGDRKVKTRQHSPSTGSSSEDERSRRHSRRRHHRSSDSDSDTSSDHRGRHHSRSKGRRKESSREKSHSSRKHSKHHGHKSRVSPSRSHYDSDRERSESKREKHKRRS